MRDVIATQRVIASLLLDDAARREWEADPSGFASARLAGEEAAMVAGLDRAGVEAMTRSHLVKKERFDYLHKLHHQYEDRKAAERAASAHPHPADHDHDHQAGHPHHHGDGHQ
jgi:hypothetical protein